MEVIQDHIKVCTLESEDARAHVQHQLDVVYGHGQKQKLDIFLPKHKRSGVPIYLFLHGGYWQELGKELYSYAARDITEAGGVFISCGYDLAPQASMTEMVKEVKQAVLYCIKYANDTGASGIYLGGHSAGGHLAAMMMSQNWNELAGQGGNDVIKGALLVSGVYDLRPIVDTYVNEPINMSSDEAFENSPWNPTRLETFIRYHNNKQVYVCIAQHDSPEFRRQSLEYEKVLKENGVNCKLVDVAAKDHFDAIELIYESNHPLTKVLLEMMGLQTVG